MYNSRKIYNTIHLPLRVPSSSSIPPFFVRGQCGPDTTPQATSHRDIPQPVEGAVSGRGVCH